MGYTWVTINEAEALARTIFYSSFAITFNTLIDPIIYFCVCRDLRIGLLKLMCPSRQAKFSWEIELLEMCEKKKKKDANLILHVQHVWGDACVFRDRTTATKLVYVIHVHIGVVTKRLMTIFVRALQQKTKSVGYKRSVTSWGHLIWHKGYCIM